MSVLSTYIWDQGRVNKAKHIVAILSTKKPLATANVLNIGTGSGHICSYLQPLCKSLHSVDVVDERKVVDFPFVQYDGHTLPSKAAEFDIVISNQVLEHVADQIQHIAECFRVLKPGGVLYLATPNRWWPFEVHHQLYFVSYLPAKLRSLYLKKRFNRDWGLQLVSWYGLRTLLNIHGNVTDMAPQILKNPERLQFTSLSPWQRKLLNCTPKFMLHLVSPLLPSFIFVAVKQTNVA